MPYTLFKKNGSEVAGLMKLPMPGVPPHWLNYVTVENADASAARVTELGGQVCKPPFDIPNVGRIAIVQDPQGAFLGIFQPMC
jgi:predicted enzyme related to lactoylglutathione lyase